MFCQYDEGEAGSESGTVVETEDTENPDDTENPGDPENPGDLENPGDPENPGDTEELVGGDNVETLGETIIKQSA